MVNDFKGPEALLQMDQFNFLPSIEVALYEASDEKVKAFLDDPDIDIWINKTNDINKFDYNKIKRYF